MPPPLRISRKSRALDRPPVSIETEKTFTKEVIYAQAASYRIASVAALGGLVFAGGQKESGKIVIATDATFPPMEMVDTNKNIVGFDVDLMNAAAKAGGFTVEFKNTAWDGILPDSIMESTTRSCPRSRSPTSARAPWTSPSPTSTRPDPHRPG